MEKKLTSFFGSLIHHYSYREDIHFIRYNGTDKPYQVYNILAFTMESEYTQEAIKGLANYLSDTPEINYYHLYKALVKNIYDLWVNPPLEELKAFNIQIGLDPNIHLKDMYSFEIAWEEKLRKKAKSDLEKKGYMVVLGSEIIEQLIGLYDVYCTTDTSFTDWIQPIDLALIKTNAYYIVDEKVFIEPIPFNQSLLLERDNQDFSVNPYNLETYFQNIRVTKRGLAAKEILEDTKIEFCFYKDIIDYLKRNPGEQRTTILQKLLKDAVNPTEPFVEAVTENFGEIYINSEDLKTEKDILDFVNLAYALEEVDWEAKTFDRHAILSSFLCHENVKYSNSPSSSVIRLYKKMNPRRTH